MSKKSKLIGWLVSYADNALGISHEIRSGRTLIGSDKEHIQLQEKSVATPHVAFRADNKHQVHLQDIFTDSGTYVMRSGSKKEEKVEGAVALRHGDWVRIGETIRFQVCLIAG